MVIIFIIIVNITGDVESQDSSVTVTHFTVDFWVSYHVPRLPVISLRT